jgi:hypothetical protein
MPTELFTRSGVCSEYQQLLANCQKALASLQHHAALLSRSAPLRHKAAAELKRLQSRYTRACASLENHEHACPNCQYVAKIAGLDFESLSSALDYYRRSA